VRKTVCGGRKGKDNPFFGKGYLITGEKNGSAKLTNEKVREIFGLAKEGLSRREIAKIYGVSPRTVKDIVSGATWKHIYAEIATKEQSALLWVHANPPQILPIAHRPPAS
jgi:DNA invertase Pin-like site-specific DNA recombinase